MSSGFEGAKGPARVSVVQKFVKDKGGTLAVSFPAWHHAISVYAHAADGSMAVGEANAGLVAEAFNTLDETGLTPRQLAEQRAELLEALQLAVDSHGVMLMTDPPQDAWKTRGVVEKARAAIANATQQRKEPGA